MGQFQRRVFHLQNGAVGGGDLGGMAGDDRPANGEEQHDIDRQQGRERPELERADTVGPIDAAG